MKPATPSPIRILLSDPFNYSFQFPGNCLPFSVLVLLILEMASFTK